MLAIMTKSLQLTIALMLLSLPVFAQKYALWHKPTKMYVSVRVDSVNLVQRANFSYYECFAGSLRITMFTKPGDSVKSFLKRRL